MKNNSQRIRPSLQQRFHRHPPAPEHVVAVQRHLVVYVNIRVGVQPFKNQIHMVVRQSCRVRLKSRSIFPVGQPDPLQPRIIVLIERIWYQPIFEQIRLHHSRHVCRMPILQFRAVGFTDGPEFPFSLERTRSRLRRNS